MCKYDDKVNVEYQRIRRHSKVCHHVARVSVQWPSLVDIITRINFLANKMRGYY